MFIVGSVRTLIAAFSIMVAHAGVAQDAGLNAPSSNAHESGTFLGVDRCERCHQAPTKADIDDRVTDFVLLNESRVWITDVHSRAYQLIDPAPGTLSKQICDKLHIADISQEQRCLSCHSNWLKDAVRPPTYRRGVACESCHGPSEHWDVPHSRADWRKKPVAEKEALGMIDVRHPIKRAEQCFGCHIGNVAENKVVTHAMYAAGHPPLPSIEIESFAAQMPRHWRYLEEKVAGNARFTNSDAFVRENHKYLNAGSGSVNEQVAAHKHRPAAVVLGGAIALREYVELIQDFAGAQEPDKQLWPELAAFDCRACHHELEVPSWRQQQRVGTIPGRPKLPSWPTALAPLAISHAAADPSSYMKQLAAFREKLSAVQTELERTPFGSPSRIQIACSELLEWLENAVIVPALARPFESRAVTDSFKLLAELATEERHDYDSARQIAWAMRILSCGISNNDLRKAIQDSLREPTVELRLDLPNGPVEQCARVSTIDESRELEPLADVLPQSLALPRQYDPELFQQQMQKLREALR